MGDFDDTDELPTTSEVFRVPDDLSPDAPSPDAPPPAASASRPDTDPAATTPLSQPSTHDLAPDAAVGRGHDAAVGRGPDAAVARGPDAVVARGRDTGRRPTGPQRPADAGDAPSEVGPVVRPPRFARARRRALLWDVGWCLVTGVVLLVLASSGRPIDDGPAWLTVLAGAVAIVWAIVLAAVAAGGVGRSATAMVGLVNLLVGAVGLLLTWTTSGVPALVLVLAAQVAGFGLVQVVTSVRR